MLNAEQECIIRWDQQDKRVHIWTNIPTMQNKLDKLCEHPAKAYRCVRKTTEGAYYECPVNLISFRQPTSEKERARRSEQARINSNLRKPTVLHTLTTSNTSDDRE